MKANRSSHKLRFPTKHFRQGKQGLPAEKYSVRNQERGTSMRPHLYPAISIGDKTHISTVFIELQNFLQNACKKEANLL